MARSASGGLSGFGSTIPGRDLDQNRAFVDQIARGEPPGPRVYQALHVAPIGDTYAPRPSLMSRFMFGILGVPVVDYNDRRSGVVAFRPEEIAMLDFALNKDGKVRFTAADALAVATIRSARVMGVDDRLGSIATGKIADLALIDGDPLANLHLIGQPVQGLFKDGKLVANRCRLEVAQPVPA